MGLHKILVGIRALIGIPFSIFILACAATLVVFLRGDERFINGPLAKKWARIVIWLANARVTVQGISNIPDTGESYLVVMNHQSNMDIPVLVHSLPLQLRFIGKIELKKVPVFGSALLKAGHFLIDRSDFSKARESLRAAGEVLKQRGVSIVFAPEGTRSSSGKLLPFKKGAFVMAIETGIPILPITIDGTRLSLPKGSMWARKANVKVTIHEPVQTEDLTYDDRNELLEKVREVIEKTLVSPPVNGNQ